MIEAMTGVALTGGLLDIVGRLKGANDANVRQAAILELTEKLLALQVQNQTLTDKVRVLSAENYDAKNWHKKQRKYKLKNFGPGCLVYARKPTKKRLKPSHYACPDCMQNEKISILQGVTGTDFTNLACNPCGVKFRYDKRTKKPSPDWSGHLNK